MTLLEEATVEELITELEGRAFALVVGIVTKDSAMKISRGDDLDTAYGGVGDSTIRAGLISQLSVIENHEFVQMNLGPDGDTEG